MKLKYSVIPTFFLISLTVAVGIIGVASADPSEPLWISGKVNEAPNEIVIFANATKFWNFTFQVIDSNSTLAVGDNFTSLVTEVLSPSAPTALNTYNYTGYIADLVIDPDIPQGTFMILGVNTSQGSNDWLAQLKALLDILSGVTGGIAEAIAGIVKTTTGYDIPPVIITLVICGFLLYGLLKYWKVIGIILMLIVAYLIISGGAFALRLMI